MKCDKCKHDLYVINSRFESEEGSTDVYSVQEMVCKNPNCDESKKEVAHRNRKKVGGQ